MRLWSCSFSNTLLLRKTSPLLQFKFSTVRSYWATTTTTATAFSASRLSPKSFTTSLPLLKKKKSTNTMTSSSNSTSTAVVVDESRLAKNYTLIRSVGEECITEEELKKLLEVKAKASSTFRCYDGFEPSGRMHIAQGVFKSINVNKCTEAGGTFLFWVADWFALMNDKMGGDLDKIKVVGQYLMEVWKAAGMNMQHVEFLWASEAINAHPKEYWLQVLDIGRRFTVARITKCCQIMGRKENNLTAAQILYPLMQCGDIFFLKADVCQLGVDQRKVNMLARDYCEVAGRRFKPIILSHHMLYGLKQGQEKMSKSDPDSAIFMEDSVEDVARKIRQAYCPSSVEATGTAPATAGEEGTLHLVEDQLKNPCLDYLQYVVFSKAEGNSMTVNGKLYTSFESVKADFLAKEITEAQLKEGLIDAINALLQPVRDHFTNNEHARNLLQAVKDFKKQSTATATTTSPSSSVDAGAGAEPVEPAVYVLFCALPYTTQWSLQTVHAILDGLQKATQEATAANTNAVVKLYLRDWSAFVSNCLGGDEGVIHAAYVVLVEALTALRPDLLAKVEVVWQSKAILANSNDYFITVINAGRKFSLDRVRSVLAAAAAAAAATSTESSSSSSTTTETQSVSDVLVPLMHVADLVHSKCTAVVSVAFPQESQANLHALALEFIPSCLPPKLASRFARVPLTVMAATRPGELLPLLKCKGEYADPECHLTVLDNEMEVNSKLKKKAFCEPGNAMYCPPLEISRLLLFPAQGSFTLSRKPENGGDKTYTTPELLAQDFALGAIHPNDLKPNVARLLNDLLNATIRARLKASKDAQAAVSELTSFEKKLAKAAAKANKSK